MTRTAIFWLAGIPLTLVFGCSGDNSVVSNGSGGTAGSGGGSSTGGSAHLAPGGGTTASTRETAGGSTAASGANTTGGAIATGGAQPTGGSNAKLGSTGGSESGGGAIAVGGSKTTGGAIAVGGSKTTGGSNTGGTTKASTGGALPAGGATAAGGSGGTSSTKSAGCGIASPLKTGNFTESIDGTSRKWMLDVPTNYDGTKPYRLVFVWHALGGSGSQIVSGGFNGLKSLANNTAIFATADGLNGQSASGTSGVGWWNANGGDMKLVQLMLDKINAGLCIDQERIFSTGFSFGGMMSYTLPFEFNVFRAVAPCSGKTGIIPYNAKYNRPIPIMAFHGDKDTVAQTALGREFFDMYRVSRNHCGDQTKAVDPSPCVQYQDCDEPSIWCEFSGAHEIWSPESQAIWKFFSQF
jgi:polyhydroxybutyrate depolymerase